MIARVWRGSTLAENADEYAAYIEESGVGPARKLEGARGSLVLRRVRGGHAEFETIILFDSMEGVCAFAGDALDEAVFFPEDDRYLVERELDVRHYEVDVRIVQPRVRPVATAAATGLSRAQPAVIEPKLPCASPPGPDAK